MKREKEAGGRGRVFVEDSDDGKGEDSNDGKGTGNRRWRGWGAR